MSGRYRTIVSVRDLQLTPVQTLLAVLYLEKIQLEPPGISLFKIAFTWTYPGLCGNFTSEKSNEC